MPISLIRDLLSSWKTLALTDIVCKIIGFVILAPLTSILFRLLLAVFGETVVTDMDIVSFLAGPAGWITLVLTAAVSVAISAVELSALLAVVATNQAGQQVSVREALWFPWLRIGPIFRVTVRLVVYVLLISAPFLMAAGAVYLTLLTEHDINYYLAQTPTDFWIAVGCGAVLAIALVAILTYLLTGWVFAFPLVLFENVPASQALRASAAKAKGHRLTILLSIATWVLAVILCTIVGIALVTWLGRAVMPLAAGSLSVLVVTAGLVLVLWAVINLVVSVLSAAVFAVLLVFLYRKFAAGEMIDLPEMLTAETSKAGFVFRWSRRSIFAVCTAMFLLAALVGIATLRSISMADHTEITAHRCGALNAPENTLAAVRQAIEDGADWVEIDVQESADGVVVVVHDSDLKRVGGVDLKIWEATAAQLREVDVGSGFDPKFKGEKVPTLDQLLGFCKGKVGVNIELKYYGHDQRLEERVAELVEKHDMAKEVVIMSMKRKAVEKLKSLRPTWKVGLLTAVAIGDITQVDASFLAVKFDLATRDFVRSAHRHQKPVYVWTVNDAVTTSLMLGRGVDNIITDDPALARSVLEQRAAMSTTERLLIEVAHWLGAAPG